MNCLSRMLTAFAREQSASEGSMILRVFQSFTYNFCQKMDPVLSLFLFYTTNALLKLLVK